MSIALRPEESGRASSERIPISRIVARNSLAAVFAVLSAPPLCAAAGSDRASPDAAATAAAETSAENSVAASAESDSDSDGVSAVVVSARRRTEDAQDVPIPIAAVGGAALEQSGQFRLENLNQNLPSTNIQFSNPRQSSIAVRGLGNNPANDALESSVGVYLDDVYLGRASMANLDLTDIEQIALLRGPQGTLFGKNTTAGVLNITTRQPTFNPEGSIEASYGNYDSYQVRGVWSQGLIDNELAGRIAFSRTDQGGFVKDVTTGRDLDGSNRSGVRGQLLFKPNEDFTLRLIGDYSEEHSDTGASVLYSAGPNNGTKYLNAVAAAGASVVYDPNYETTTLNGYQHMDVRQGGGSAEANWKVGDYLLTSITAYRSWWFSPYNDGDSTNVDALSGAGQKVDDNQWSEELRIASPADRPVSYVAGLYYFNQHQDNLLYTQYGSDATAIQDLALGTKSFADGYSQTVQYLKTSSAAVFGQATWRPAQSWELALGLRDTQETKDVSLYRSSTGAPAFANSPSFSAYSVSGLSLNNNTISALASASYHFTPDVLGYWSLARGAKAGGINPTAPVPGLALESLYVKPEVAIDSELGIKSSLLDRHLILNTNLFWTQVKDYQSTLVLPPPVGGGAFLQILSNIGKVRTRGVESDITAIPTEGLALSLSASYNDAVYLSYDNAPCPAEVLAPLNLAPSKEVCNLSGKQVVGAPSWITNPSITYEHPLPGSLTAVLFASYSWRSWFFGSPDDSQYARIPSYGLLDVRGSLEGHAGKTPWTVTFWSNNALNKRYVLGGITSTSSLYNYNETPGLPRTFGATVHVDL
jgi:iron complex outermembrane recepter protein